MTREQAADDEKPDRLSLRGLLARITRNTDPKQPPRKQPDNKSGRREVRGD